MELLDFYEKRREAGWAQKLCNPINITACSSNEGADKHHRKIESKEVIVWAW